MTALCAKSLAQALLFKSVISRNKTRDLGRYDVSNDGSILTRIWHIVNIGGDRSRDVRLYRAIRSSNEYLLNKSLKLKPD